MYQDPMNPDPMNQTPPDQGPINQTPINQGPMSQSDEQQARMWGMLCHLSALVGFIGVPFGNIIGPLVVWLIKKDQYAFVHDQGRESLNFQISMTIYTVIAGILAFLLIGIPALLVLPIIDLILVIIAAVQANSGQAYRYPATIRFIS